jgi:hypothetical protein
LSPGAEFALGKTFLKASAPAFKCAFFTKLKKMRLTQESPQISKDLADFRYFLIKCEFNHRANRGKCCIFLTVAKHNGPPVSRQPVKARSEAGL